MTCRPEVTYADLDIALFKASSSAEKIQYIYYDNGKEVARFDSADTGKKWLEEVEVFGVDFNFGFEGDITTLTREVDYIDLGAEKGFEILDHILEDYKKEADTPIFKGYISAATGAEVFRHKVATLKKYKGARAGRKPTHLEAVRDYALSKSFIKQVPSYLECDDYVQAYAQKKGETGQLLSLDKDALTAVGCWVLNTNYFDEAIFSDPETLGFIEKSGDNVRGVGYLFLLGQMVMGDTADSVTGVPKAGKAKALEVLTPFNNKPVSELPDALLEVAKLYKKAYGDNHTYKHWETGESITRGWYEMMLEQGQLLWMLKSSKDNVEKSVLKYLDKGHI